MAMFNGCIRLPEETFEGQIGKSRQSYSKKAGQAGISCDFYLLANCDS